MADQTTVLQLVLDQLGMGNTISTMDDRIAIQKIVCLTQEAGLQLGYSFNWYVRGPYSPALASDYYQLAAARASIEANAKKFSLKDSAVSATGKVALVASVPAGAGLDRVNWLELLASIVFLMKRYRLSVEATKEKIEKSKPALYPHFDLAYSTLNRAGFQLG